MSARYGFRWMPKPPESVATSRGEAKVESEPRPLTMTLKQQRREHPWAFSRPSSDELFLYGVTCHP